MVVPRNRDIEKNRGNGQKKKKKDFTYFGMLGPQKHPYVGRILKSIHAQFYMATKGPFGRFLLQPYYSERKATQKQVPQSQKGWYTSSGYIRKVRSNSKAGTDMFGSAFVVWAFVAYSSKCDCIH